MLELAAGLAFALVVTLVSGASPRFGLSVAFCAYILLPSAVGQIGAGGVKLHIATLVVIALALSRMAAKKRPTDTDAPRVVPIGVHYLICAFLVGALLTQWSVGDTVASSLAFLTNQVVAPYLFFVLCVHVHVRDSSFRLYAIRAVLFAGLMQSVVAFGAAVGFWPQPYGDSYSRALWWSEMVNTGRQLGTLDHPLNLALLLAACVPLVAYVQKPAYRTVALIILVAGLGLTQSRIGLVAGAVGLLYLATFGAKGFKARSSILVAALAGYFALNASGYVDQIVERISDDSGSTEARSRALDFLLPHWTDYFFYGVGIFDGKTLLLENGLTSSAESAVLAYSLAFGVAFTLCYFAAMAWLMLRAYGSAGGMSPTLFAAIATFVSIQFYSSIATESSASIIVWITLFLAVSGNRSDRHPEPAPIPKMAARA